MIQTRNQKIAADVFTKVSAHSNKPKEQKEQYKSTADKLPILVQTAGLAQALSFIEARGSDMANLLLTDLSNTLGRPRLSEDSRNTQSLQEYLHLTRQVMLALLWYKRFASSVLDA